MLRQLRALINHPAARIALAAALAGQAVAVLSELTKEYETRIKGLKEQHEHWNAAAHRAYVSYLHAAEGSDPAETDTAAAEPAAAVEPEFVED